MIKRRRWMSDINGLKFDFESKIIKYTKPALMLIGFVYLATTLIYLGNLLYCGSFTASELGDFIGGYLGTLISIFTVILVAQTYYSQKKELEDQKKLIKLQREEMKMQRTVMEDSRVFELVYQETDFITNYLASFDGGINYFRHKIYYMNNDIEHKELLKVETGENSLLSRYNDVVLIIYPVIDNVFKFYRRLEYLTKERNDKDFLISLATNKLNMLVLELCRTIINYLIDLKDNPNRHESFDEEAALKIVNKCNKIKEYFYADELGDFKSQNS